MLCNNSLPAGQLKGDNIVKLTGKALAAAAYKARLLAVDAVFTAASGHPGGSMSCIDALTTLYFNEMNIDPADPRNPDRDRFVGQGLSAAVGMALAARHCGKDYRTYAILGDGEIAEGQIWEAVMAAAKWKLDNLCIFVDLNGLQIDGRTSDVMPTDPVDSKFKAFNWNVISIDGHDFDQILSALAKAREFKGMPTAIIMKTTKGKGISFMENQAGWHGKAPNAEQFATAKAELEAKIAELEG